MKKAKYRHLVFYVLMMALPVIQFCIMCVGVNFNSLLLAFKRYDINLDFTWTLSNFSNVISGFFNDHLLQNSLKNSVMFYVIITCISLPTSLVISFFFYKKFRFARQLKLLLFLPSVISGVVTVTCFYYLADRGWPILVELFTGKKDTMGLLVNSETRLGTLIGYNLFYSLPGSFLFYTSAMSGIDDAISEAARIDGASMMQEFRHVTIPMIYPTLYTFLLSGISGILMGDYGMYAFYKATGKTVVPTMGYYFTSGIMSNDAELKFPHFAALGIVLSVISSAIVFVTSRVLKRWDPYTDVEKRRKTK